MCGARGIMAIGLKGSCPLRDDHDRTRIFPLAGSLEGSGISYSGTYLHVTLSNGCNGDGAVRVEPGSVLGFVNLTNT